MAKTDKTTFELIYSAQHSDYIAGRAYSNPRFFTSPRQGVTKVLLVGDWPNIEAAYSALGVPVERMDAAAAIGHPADPAVAASAAKIVPSVTAAERSATPIPDDWRKLPWTGRGATLRSLAAVFSDVPVLNKTQAIAAVEAELRRRADALNASAGLSGDGTGDALPELDPANPGPHEGPATSAGLTRTEMEADLAAMNVDFDPALDDGALRALRDEARAIRDA